MNTEYEPGTVALLRHADGSVRRAMYFSDGKWRCFDAPDFPHTPLPSELTILTVLAPVSTS